MTNPQPLEVNIPVLTEIIRTNPVVPSSEVDTLIAEIQTKLASRTFALTDALLRSACAEMEATLFERVASQLRRQLPELIDATLREHFDRRNDD